MELSELKALIEAIKAQTEAISQLAESNMMLVRAMAECDDTGDADAGGYLDGAPR